MRTPAREAGRPVEAGIHVHARQEADSDKEIDGTYPAVAVRQWHRQTVAVTRLARQHEHPFPKDSVEARAVATVSADVHP